MADTAADALAPSMIDSHCHLDLDDFADDRQLVLDRAQQLGVSRFHIPGTTAKRWSALLELAKQPTIDVSLGLHPYFLAEFDDVSLEEQMTELTQLFDAYHQDIFAVGECGLDAVISADLGQQNHVFEAMIALAKHYHKPLILHARKTHHHIHQLFNQQQFVGRGIIHAFSGSKEVAKSYVERGFLLGIGGTITYPRANKTRQAIEFVGLEHLVLETDSPDMPVAGFQGQRNTPERLPIIAKALADLLGTDVATVAARTTENYLSLSV